MKKKYIVFILSVLLKSIQAQVLPGHFKTYLPYDDFVSVAVADDYVYAAKNASLMYVNKSSGETSFWSKVDGLSDIEIFKIAFDKETKTLVICYSNGNIDLIENDQLTNIPDIKNKQITGSKKINNIYFYNNNAYLSTDFGVVVLDLETKNFIETWFTTINNIIYAVVDLKIFEESFYMATSKGTFTIDVDDIHKVDFSQWSLIDALEDFPVTILQPFKDQLIAIIKDAEEYDKAHLYWILKDHEWQYDSLLSKNSYGIVSLDCNDDELLIVDYNFLLIKNEDLETVDINYFFENDLYISQGLFDKEDVWVSTNLGLFKVAMSSDGFQTHFSFPGPGGSGAESITHCNNIMAVVEGSLFGWAWHFEPPILSWFKDGQWNCLSDAFTTINPRARALCNVIINPQNNDEMYVASWGEGLYKINNGIITNFYNETNSPLESHQGYENTRFVDVSGLCYDKNNNLWLTNCNIDSSSKYLRVIKNDGSWVSFDFGVFNLRTGTAKQVLVDQQNNKWVVFPRDCRLFVLNDNGTIDNKTDDKYVEIIVNGASAEEEKANELNCIVEDKNGYIWLGTNRGIKVIYSPQSVFNQTVYPQCILLEQMGYYQYLLSFETVTAIAVDGGNQKWIGTSKAGVFLVSPDGTQELLHFTTDNSPLLSNQISSISINELSGEVFFGTSAGIVSYGGNATQGKENYNELKIFPNPVRETYSGNITVTGLMENSFCKILDVAGNLVWQGYAKGGTLTWNGQDFYGNRPATGVYFVVASDKTGKNKKTGKFLLIH
ncbi:MAG: hypothetical protein LBU51_01750 [Bacteroidales bacterium]|jgi:ligand-binding sensor domain-containing protein|nr:hypothetical protein [Bacteroidales bacterium]